ncbi:MAG: ATP-binding cassette domain-containing protein [Planctomycetes bacterium]|nr:ATP-binding cassette domain-containing protein [Planctomycetota bacterium]
MHTGLLAAVAGLCGGLGTLLFSLFGGPATARVLMLIGSLCAGVAAMALLRPTLHQQLERTRVAYRRRRFGFVFQFYHLLPELSVLENVMLPRQVACGFFGWSRERVAAETDARRVLERVGLAERLNHKPAELSGGERQRVAIARALVHHPRVLLADEPTGNLDAEAGANIMRILCGLRGEGQTIVMVTHDPTIAANADRVLVLERGRLRPT